MESGQFSWKRAEDFTHFFGAREEQMKPLLQLRSENAKEEVKTYSDAKYINFKDLGLSLMFRRDKVGEFFDSLFIYNGGLEGFSQYKGTLPAGLEWNMSNAEIVKALGEPSKKPTPGLSNMMPIFIDYENRGLQIDFLSRNYDEKKNPITNICLYPPKRN